MAKQFRFSKSFLCAFFISLFLCSCSQPSNTTQTQSNNNLPTEDAYHTQCMNEWQSAYIYPEEFGTELSAPDALSSLYGEENYTFTPVESSDSEMVKVLYSAKGVLNDDIKDISYEMLWDKTDNSVMPIRMTVNSVEMSPRFMEGFIYICEGYTTLGEELVTEALKGNTSSYWEEMRIFKEDVAEMWQDLDEEFVKELEDILLDTSP